MEISGATVFIWGKKKLHVAVEVTQQENIVRF